MGITGDGKSLVAVGQEGSVKIWDLLAGEERVTWPGADGTEVYSQALTADSQVLVTGHWREVANWAGGQTATRDLPQIDGEIRFRELRTGLVRARLQHTPRLGVSRMALAPDGKTVAAIEIARKGEFRVCLWDVAIAKPRAILHMHCNSLAFSPDSMILATGREEVRLWDSGSGKEMASFPIPERNWPINGLTFTPDGRYLAGGDNRGRVLIWDVPGRSLRARLYHGDGEWRAFPLLFSPDGRSLSVALNAMPKRFPVKPGELAPSRVAVWDVATFDLRGTIEASLGFVWAMAYTPDSRTLAATSGSHILLWGLDNWPAGRK
jgi:WD40 repeat protein